MKKIGIDPGLSGGLAFLDGDAVIDYCKTPVVKVNYKNKTRSEINMPELYEVLMKWKVAGAQTIIVEKVGAMPGQGVTSMFRFGESFGLVKGIAWGLKFEIVTTTPREWKTRMGLIGEEKDAAITLANTMLSLNGGPHINHSGIADAILIAASH